MLLPFLQGLPTFQQVLPVELLQTFYRLLLRRCSRTQDYVSVSYSNAGLEPEVFDPRPSDAVPAPGLTLGSLHLCALCSQVNLLTATHDRSARSKSNVKNGLRTSICRGSQKNVK